MYDAYAKNRVCSCTCFSLCLVKTGRHCGYLPTTRNSTMTSYRHNVILMKPPSSPPCRVCVYLNLKYVYICMRWAGNGSGSAAENYHLALHWRQCCCRGGMWRWWVWWCLTVHKNASFVSCLSLTTTNAYEWADSYSYSASYLLSVLGEARRNGTLQNALYL